MSAKKAAPRRSGSPAAGDSGPGFWGRYLPLAICLGAGFVSVLLQRQGSLSKVADADWIPLATALALPLLAVAALKVGGYRGDWSLVWLALLLSGLGVLFKFRTGAAASEGLLPVWQLPLLIGVGMMVACALLFRGAGQSLLGGMAPLAWLAAVGLLAAILVFGSRYRGMVYLAGNMNPSEACKPLLVLGVAAYLARYAERDGSSRLGWRGLAGLGVLWSIPMGLLLVQRDLGMIVQLNATLLLLLYAATGRIAWLAAGLLGLLGLGYALIHFNLHGADRIATWLNPFRDPTGKGWQVLQSLSAQYTGGLLGTGLGTGSPKSVPIVTSDFIYAAVAEEAGYIGCLLIVFAYATLFGRGLRAVSGQKEAFTRLLGGGLLFSLGIQTALNLAGATKTLPMTGITLPFISHGGSSLITSLTMVGLVLACASPVKSGRK